MIEQNVFQQQLETYKTQFASLCIFNDDKQFDLNSKRTKKIFLSV